MTLSTDETKEEMKGEPDVIVAHTGLVSIPAPVIESESQETGVRSGANPYDVEQFSRQNDAVEVVDFDDCCCDGCCGKGKCCNGNSSCSIVLGYVFFKILACAFTSRIHSFSFFFY